MKELTQEDIKQMLNGVKKFAWQPTWTKWTGWIWFTHYWEFYSGEKRADGSVFIWSRSPEDFDPMIDVIYLNDEDALVHKLKMPHY